MSDLRSQVIERVLGHFSGDFLRRAARAAPTDRGAADSLRMHINGGAMLGHLAWAASPKGIVYGGPGSSPISGHDCEGVIPWLELARAARTDAEQLALEVAS